MKRLSPLIGRGGRGGFTLVEMLFVVLIMVILIALAVRPMLLGRAVSVTTAGNQVMEDLAYARELAIANNQPVEVWFLRPTGGTFLGALQIYTVDQDGNATSYGGPHHLPLNVGIDSGSTLSTLIATANKRQWTSPQVKPAITGYQTNYDAWFVRFMPDGTTTLTSNPAWFVTLHDVSLGDQLATLPKNYASVSIDSVTGAVSLYRP